MKPFVERVMLMSQGGMKVKDIARKLRKSKWRVYGALRQANKAAYANARPPEVNGLAATIKMLEEKVGALYEEAHKIEAAVDALKAIARVDE